MFYSIIVSGGRDNYEQKDYLFNLLDAIQDQSDKPIHIIQGGAKGIDALAKEWAQSRGAMMTQVDAEWDKYGKSAGMRRNKDMINLKPDLVICVKGGIGTENMANIALQEEIPLLQYKGNQMKRIKL